MHYPESPKVNSGSVWKATVTIYMPQEGFKPRIYDSLLLEFAVAHKPTHPPRPDALVFVYAGDKKSLTEHGQL